MSPTPHRSPLTAHCSPLTPLTAHSQLTRARLYDAHTHTHTHTHIHAHTRTNTDTHAHRTPRYGHSGLGHDEPSVRVSCLSARSGDGRFELRKITGADVQRWEQLHHELQVGTVLYLLYLLYPKYPLSLFSASASHSHSPLSRSASQSPLSHLLPPLPLPLASPPAPTPHPSSLSCSLPPSLPPYLSSPPPSPPTAFPRRHDQSRDCARMPAPLPRVAAEEGEGGGG